MYQLRKAYTINAQRNVPKPNSTKILHKNFESADYSCHHFHRKIKHQSQSLSQHLMKLFFFHFFLLLSLWVDNVNGHCNCRRKSNKSTDDIFLHRKQATLAPISWTKISHLLTIIPTPHKKHCDLFFHKSSK